MTLSSSTKTCFEKKEVASDDFTIEQNTGWQKIFIWQKQQFTIKLFNAQVTIILFDTNLILLIERF